MSARESDGQTLSGRTRRVELKDQVMKRLTVSRAFKDKAGCVNGLEWDRDGESLISSADDESVHIYSVAKGDVAKTLHSKKYGVDMIQFTRQGPRVCVCASRASHDNEYAIRLWDLVENRYMRYFPLPAQVCRGCGLSVHPTAEVMLVCCVDGKVRLYSFNQDTPLTTIASFTKAPVAAFDHSGFVFACYLGRAKLHLFSSEHLAQPEFLSFNLKGILLTEEAEHVSSILFSPDDRHILLSTNFQNLVSLDAFTGERICKYNFDNVKMERGAPCGYPTYTPDGKFVLCGGLDKAIHVWNATTGQCVTKLTGHPGIPTYVKFNPRKAILASACLNVVLWQPALPDGPFPGSEAAP